MVQQQPPIEVLTMAMLNLQNSQSSGTNLRNDPQRTERDGSVALATQWNDSHRAVRTYVQSSFVCMHYTKQRCRDCRSLRTLLLSK